jgi:hypothetical protein
MTHPILERAKFDETKTFDAGVAYSRDRTSHPQTYYEGANAENARLLPIIETLVRALEVSEGALKYYANHESVIAEAYHSNDEKQITCVHTFISHKAKEALVQVQKIMEVGK